MTFIVLVKIFFNTFVCGNYCIYTDMGVGSIHMQGDFRSNHKGRVQGSSGIPEMQRHSHHNFFGVSLFFFFPNSSCKKCWLQKLVLE